MDAIDTTSLDACTAAVTAFATFEQLEEAMAYGYVPTIYPRSRRQRLLIKAVRAMGYPVFPYAAR